MLKENNTQRHFYIEEVILILLLTLSPSDSPKSNRLL